MEKKLWVEVENLFNAQLSKDCIESNIDLHGEETYLMDADYKSIIDYYIEAYSGKEKEALERILRDHNNGLIYCGRLDNTYYILFN